MSALAYRAFGFSLFALLVLAGCGDGDICAPSADRPVAPGDAPLYAYWTDNAFPLRLVVDAESGCPDSMVQASADVWAPHSGGFAVSSGRFKAGKDRDYAHVYLRVGKPQCPGGPCIGHTQLTAYEVSKGTVPRAMYASITVESCDMAVIAHELGHALGLDEAKRPDALMSPVGSSMQISETESDRLTFQCGEP